MNTYIKFSILESDRKKVPESISKRLVKEILDHPAPISNPDFVNVISNVTVWLIEFEDDSYYPNREIGLNESGTPVVILPWKNNYGYWTDSNIVMKDFSSNFAIEVIPRKQFAENWKLFEDKREKVEGER